jgi:hypothetical protein
MASASIPKAQRAIPKADIPIAEKPIETRGEAVSVTIQKAIYSALTGSAPVMALVTGVYDHPPENAVLPVIGIGNDSHGDAGTKSEELIDYNAQIDVWADNLSFASVRSIQDKIRDALHQQSLSVDSGTVIYCRESSQDIFEEPDGEVHGVQFFTILYQYA